MTSCRDHFSPSTQEHLLHRLHAIQREYLHISRESIQQVAREFDLPIAQVATVVAFHSFLHTQPRGRFDILFSNCTSCGYLFDGQNLLQMLCRALQVSPGKTRSDGLISIDETSCIGMCDQGPSLLVNGIPITHLDSIKIAQLARHIALETPLADWPKDWFDVHQTIHRRDRLLTESPTSVNILHKALTIGRDSTLAILLQSGLRGRGGAGFATGKKWQVCRETPGEAHYVVCNADEGEPGTFKDRLLLTAYAENLFTGMALCAFVIGATQGFVYLRAEYRYLFESLQKTLQRCRHNGLLGHTNFDFDITIVVGAGAYICGEESALIESLEGKPGIPRIRPPFPVTHGYLGQPTVVNNVETFITAAHIVHYGSEAFKATGTATSTGTKILSISGDCTFPGIYEYPFGTRIQQMLNDCGAHPVQAVQIGGPAGTLLDASEFERTLAFDDVSSGGSLLIFGPQRDLLTVHRNFARFFAHESCGFCTPCRVGTQLIQKELDAIADGHGSAHTIKELQQLGHLVQHQSHCGLGHTAANHVLEGLHKFPQVFSSRLRPQFTARFDLDQALAVARQITHRDDTAAHLDND